MIVLPVLIVCLGTAHGGGNAPLGPADFKNQGRIAGSYTADAPACIALTPEVFSHSRADLGDLRVYDDRGREMPYVVYEHVVAAKAPVSVALDLVAYDQTETGEEIVLQSPRGPLSIHGLEFVINGKDFNKQVDIAAGESFGSMQPLVRDVIFDFTSRVNLRRTEVPFAATAAAVIRVTLADVHKSMPPAAEISLRYEGLEFWSSRSAPGPFRVDRVLAWTGERRAAHKTLDHITVSAPPTRLDAHGDTIIDLGVRLPVASVTLDVENPYYHRRVQLLISADGKDETFRPAGEGVVYKIPGMPDSENVVSFANATAHLRLKVLNEDNPPLRVNNVDIAWVRRSLYFVAEFGRNYTLYVGSSAAHAPRYELQALIPDDPVRLAGFTQLSLSPLEPNAAYAPRLTSEGNELAEKVILRAFVLLLLCGLSIWAYRLLKRVPRPPGDQAG